MLPVKRECRNQFPGTVVEVSGSGGTCFMEPAAVAKLQTALAGLEVEEDGEVRRILYTLSALVADHAASIRRNMEVVETLDFLFAKAKLSAAMEGTAPAVTTRRSIRLRAARHPLLPKGQCVPLDFTIGDGVTGVIITGPNTGGKTVALKTVGLLSMMAQCGLHIPAAPESVVAMHGSYWCDIGDSQGIAENLSTFSGHMTAVIDILEHAGSLSLVLLDELGSGTDPAEGMGIAIAVLEELRSLGCLFLVTTHYPQVKSYAEAAPDIQSARMAFDRDTLSPLYRLEQGKSGESCAIQIARRLGLPEHLLERAQMEAGRSGGTASPPDASVPLPSGAKPGHRRTGGGIEKQTQKKAPSPHAAAFGIGDSVIVYPGREIGLVFAPADDLGRIGVQIKERRQWVVHKRLKLKAAAAELYPENYDLSQIFETVENRKLRRDIGRTGHQPDREIHYTKEEWEQMRSLLERTGQSPEQN